MADTTFRGLLTITAAAVAFASVGCTTQAPDDEAPDFVEGSGQAAPIQDAYPQTPTGYEEGSILPNMEFIGYVDYTDPNLPGLQALKLSQFYNPTGDGVFPEGSPYGAGTPKPKAINMLISSVWCGPCNYEAESVLPAEYAKYKPQGGHFLAILIDGSTPGTAATLGDLYNWSNKYQTNYSIVVDPENKVMQWYPAAFPGNLILRTSDMKIIRVEAGVPDASFWYTFEQVLDGSYAG